MAKNMYMVSIKYMSGGTMETWLDVIDNIKKKEFSNMKNK